MRIRYNKSTVNISIHAPRTGSDATLEVTTKPIFHFNPRSPHGERLISTSASYSIVAFQSTLPARGATDKMFAAFERGFDISIHAPRTGSDVQRKRESGARFDISIHAPRTGSDAVNCCKFSVMSRFQSTLPARGATLRRRSNLFAQVISIHAPRTGSDVVPSCDTSTISYFNPRSPHGERLFNFVKTYLTIPISIHAPRTGSDFRYEGVMSVNEKFQSTLPARGATRGERLRGRRAHISIHAPRTGSDASSLPTGRWASNFNPRSPHGERPRQKEQRQKEQHFNPRSPHGERRAARASDCVRP